MESLREVLVGVKETFLEALWSWDDSSMGSLLLHPQSTESDAGSPPAQRHSPNEETPTEESGEASHDQAGSDDQAGPDDPGLSTWDEEEARNAVMLVFEEENEDDFTDGPCCVVEAHDGVKPCIALLIPSDLSSKIKNMVITRRRFEVEKQTAEAKREAVERFSSILYHEKLNHEARIATEKARNTDPDQGHLDKIASLQQELETLELLSQNMEDTKANIELNLKKRTNLFAKVQRSVGAYLEEAFVYAKLSEPEVQTSPEPVPEYDLQTEYQTLCDELQEVEGGPRISEPLDTSNDYLRAKVPVRTPAQKAMDQASTDLWEAKGRLHEAQYRFDMRDELRRQEWRQNVEAEAAGEQCLDDSVEDFDCRWVTCISDITRELREAEEAVAEAKIAAREAGVPCEDDGQSSCFADDAEDDSTGPFASADNDIPQTVVLGIQDWVLSLSEAQDPESMDTPDIDDWNCSEVGMSDSGSMIAEGSQRRRIDDWQQIYPAKKSTI